MFDSYEEMLRQVDNPDLDVDESCVLVLRNVGPVGGPGMPEWGMIPIPAKLVRRGVKDILRISDARMSGTSFGTVILHVSPESAIGGPLAAVKTGDEICVDVPRRKIDVLISDNEFKKRMEEWKPMPMRYSRGYYTMFLKHVLQAHEGCDFDFLCATRSDEPYEPQMGRT